MIGSKHPASCVKYLQELYRGFAVLALAGEGGSDPVPGV